MGSILMGPANVSCVADLIPGQLNLCRTLLHALVDLAVKKGLDAYLRKLE